MVPNFLCSVYYYLFFAPLRILNSTVTIATASMVIYYTPNQIFYAIEQIYLCITPSCLLHYQSQEAPCTLQKSFFLYSIVLPF